MQLLHHDADSGFDWMTVVYVLIVLAVIGAIGFGIWKLIDRKRYG